jgi:hypothetical protein
MVTLQADEPVETELVYMVGRGTGAVYASLQNVGPEHYAPPGADALPYGSGETKMCGQAVDQDVWSSVMVLLESSDATRTGTSYFNRARSPEPGAAAAGWIMLDLGAGVKHKGPVTSYRIMFGDSGSDGMVICPKKWDFQAKWGEADAPKGGGIDDPTWETQWFLTDERDLQANVRTCSFGQWHRFAVMHPPQTFCRWGCPNTRRYRYYRWLFTEQTGSIGQWVDVREARVYTSTGSEQDQLEEERISPEKLNSAPEYREAVSGEFLRTAEVTPQVQVVTNGLATACSGDCGFRYKRFSFRVTGVSPQEVNQGDMLTITGSDFLEYPVSKVRNTDCNML